LEPNGEKYGDNVLSCAKCGKEILDKESSFCAYCGTRFDSKPQSSDLTTGAGILAIIAATFSIAVGVFGIIYYQSYVAYYASYGLDSSGSIGFLFFLSFAFVSSGFGFAGGMFALTKKRFKFSVIGILLMLASTLFTFIALWQYQYGYPEVVLLSGISIGAFSLASALFVVRSKSEFI
jgi:DNA-directed RNA polymerase subunit RPC12/RpoP